MFSVSSTEKTSNIQRGVPLRVCERQNTVAAIEHREKLEIRYQVF